MELCLAFPVFISPIVWNMCKTLPYESVYFKELHNEQGCYWPTIYRAGAAVVSTITGVNYITPFPRKVSLGRLWQYEKIYRDQSCKMQTADWLRTIVFRVRKQRDYCCHVLICMVKTIVRSLRFFLTGNWIQLTEGK